MSCDWCVKTERQPNRRCTAPISMVVRRNKTPSSVVSGVESKSWRKTWNGNVCRDPATGELKMSPKDKKRIQNYLSYFIPYYLTGPYQMERLYSIKNFKVNFKAFFWFLPGRMKTLTKEVIQIRFSCVFRYIILYAGQNYVNPPPPKEQHCLNIKVDPLTEVCTWTFTQKNTWNCLISFAEIPRLPECLTYSDYSNLEKNQSGGLKSGPCDKGEGALPTHTFPQDQTVVSMLSCCMRTPPRGMWG